MTRLSCEHLQPLIGRLQRPAAPVTRGELAWLRRARRVLPEFAAEFRATVHQLRSQARFGRGFSGNCCAMHASMFTCLV